jgi:hypothetical protein
MEPKEGGMRASNMPMKRLGTASVLLILLSVSSCSETNGLTVRPKYTSFSVEAELERKVTWDQDADFEFSFAGVEFAFEPNPKMEFFLDASDAEIVDDEFDAYDSDGYGLGIGLRSAYPREEGLGSDWSIRLGYHRMDDSEIVSDPVYDSREWEFEGMEADLRLGAYYAVPFRDDYLLSPHAGILVKAIDGQIDDFLNDDILGVSHHAATDYEVFAAALYMGFRLNKRELKDINAEGGVFLGTEELLGFYLSVGMTF